MGPAKTKEDEDAKRLRERERMLAEKDSAVADRMTAESLQTDIMSAFGKPSLMKVLQTRKGR